MERKPDEMRKKVGRYLIILAQEHLEFRIPELESVAAISGRTLNEIWDKSTLNLSRAKATKEEAINAGADCAAAASNSFTEKDTPFVLLHGVDENEVLRIMSRSIFAKQAYEIWGYGSTYATVKQSVARYPQALKGPVFGPESSFCMRVKAFGRKISLKEQIEKIDGLEDTLPFEGQVDLKTPKNEFHLIEDYGVHRGKKLFEPHCLYFGRLIAEGSRDLIHSFSVKKRKFIGNTSMEAGLSFIMSNLAKVRPGGYICDPFVGTGSLLIAAAHYGGYVTGGDINYNILHARGKSSRVGAGYREKDETIQNNLRQYGLEKHYIDVIRHDAARHPWCCPNRASNGIFDAIITDPPYGIREKCRKVGTEKDYVPEPNQLEVHHPEQTAYHLNHVYSDLLTFASVTLVPGGRLVYWIPIYKPDYSEDRLPSHPNLRLLYNSEQPLKRSTSRRLIVMEKCKGSYQTGVGETSKMAMFEGHNAFRDKYFKKNMNEK